MILATLLKITHLSRACARMIERGALVLADITALTAALFLGHLMNWLPKGAVYASYNEWWAATGQNILLLYSVLAGTAVVRLAGLGHYTSRKPFWDEVEQVLRTIFLFAALDAIVMFLLKAQFSRLGFTLSWGLAFLLIPSLRTIVKRALLSYGLWKRPTVIIGAGEGVQEAIAALHSDPLMGFEVIALMLPEGENAPGLVSEANQGFSVLPLNEQLMTTLDQLEAAQIVLTFEANEWLQSKHLVERLYRYYPDVHLIPPNYGLPLCGVEISHFFRHEVMLLTLRNNLGRIGPRIIKRTFDMALSVLLLAILSPLLLWIAWRIRQQGGNAFYSHERVGQQGRTFRCYKFRTMLPNSDRMLDDLLARDPAARAEWACDRKLKNDPRITPIGHFLRRTSLDELPQLWNVLKGDMSLVGPRPVTAAEMGYYGDQADYYLETRPGITGVWQISGRNDISYARRVYLDAWYAKNWTFWYDLVILIKTVQVVFGRSGAY